METVRRASSVVTGNVKAFGKGRKTYVMGFQEGKNASDLEIRVSCAGPEEQSCQVKGNRKSIEVAGTGHT